MLFAHGEPAAGAPTEDLIPATIVGLLLIGALVAFAIAHRSGRTRLLAQLGAVGERVTGLPGWASVPMAITGVSLIVAVFGFYWDVATHIDDGRDAGPFANPSHYFIIFGLAGIALAGIVGVLMGAARSATTVRVREGWNAPVGAVLLLVCGGIAVLGFPLDDVWHRLFGQDVTLWSPTHMQMVGGASLSTLALWILHVEGGRSAVDTDKARRSASFLEPVVAGAFLVGLSAFQAEFDYSVPQFRLLFHPILLMAFAGIALVPARMRLGRGGALKAVLFFIGLRAVLSVVVGPVLGHTTLHFPLYLAEAVAIELVALRIKPERGVVFGAVAGAAIGTFGLAGEWLWSHLWMTMEWPAALLVEGITLGLIAAVSGGCLGAFIGRALDGGTMERAPRLAGVLTALGIFLVLAYPLATNASLQGSVDVTLDPVEGRDGRWVDATLTMDPKDVAEGSAWFNITAWQGGGSFVESLVETSPGVYEASGPVPVFGEWKALVRLQHGRSLMAVPIFLPEDPAIPAEEVPAQASFTRDLMSDKKIVLREAREVEAPLTFSATGAILAIWIAWVIALGWGLRKLQRDGASPRPRFRSAVVGT
ncbi:MAG TPA: hypothetical protein VFS18_04255 [Actinomycetota bacterium]|nr:hypothetical protein [Actinomycetota bacterium]